MAEGEGMGCVGWLVVGFCALLIFGPKKSDSDGKERNEEPSFLTAPESYDFYDTAERALKKLDEGKKLTKYERDCLNEYLEKELGFE